MDTSKADFLYSFAGMNLILLTPISQAACDWTDENIVEVMPRFGGAIPIEPRFFDNVVSGFMAEGLTIQGH